MSCPLTQQNIKYSDQRMTSVAFVKEIPYELFLQMLVTLVDEDYLADRDIQRSKDNEIFDIYLNFESMSWDRPWIADRPGIGADALATDLRLRDQSDATRMRPAEGAEVIDTTRLAVDDVVAQIEELVRAAERDGAGSPAAGI